MERERDGEEMGWQGRGESVMEVVTRWQGCVTRRGKDGERI